MKATDRRAYGLAAFIGGAGVMHFVSPSFFDSVVPRWMPGRPRTTTYLSGVAELVGAGLVLTPATRRIGGWWCVLLLLGVYPANIQMALDGGVQDAPPSPLNSAAAAWIRLPMQFPMIWSAYRVARDAAPQRLVR
jgi:uncharacterized membrane protein